MLLWSNWDCAAQDKNAVSDTSWVATLVVGFKAGNYVHDIVNDIYLHGMFCDFFQKQKH